MHTHEINAALAATSIASDEGDKRKILAHHEYAARAELGFWNYARTTTPADERASDAAARDIRAMARALKEWQPEQPFPVADFGAYNAGDREYFRRVRDAWDRANPSPAPTPNGCNGGQS